MVKGEPESQRPWFLNGWVITGAVIAAWWFFGGGGFDRFSASPEVVIVTPRQTSVPSNNPDDWCGGKPPGNPRIGDEMWDGYIDCMDRRFKPTEDAEYREWHYEEYENSLIEQAIDDGKEVRDEPERWDYPEWFDCEDFSIQREAQYFYEAAGGPEEDPFLLDEDDDEIACELLPDVLEDVTPRRR